MMASTEVTMQNLHEVDEVVDRGVARRFNGAPATKSTEVVELAQPNRSKTTMHENPTN